MSDRELFERLRLQTGEANAVSAGHEDNLRRSGSRPPDPGDVYALGQDPDSPMEWVVLAGADDPRHLIAALADTNPMVGSRDLALRDGSVGPLTVRLGTATTWVKDVFDPEMRRGVLEPDSLALLEHGYEAVMHGEARGTVRQREVDVDPAYEDWFHDYVEPAQQALRVEAARVAADEVLDFPEQPGIRPPEASGRMVSIRWVYALAAALVLMTVGLSSLILSQQGQIGRLSRLSFNLPISEIRLNEVERSPAPIAVPRDADSLLLYIFLNETEPCDDYLLEVLDNAGRKILSRSIKSWPVDDLNLFLPREILEQRLLTLRLHGTCGGEIKLLDERNLRIAFI